MKSPTAGKRARPPRKADYAKSFQKDWERLDRSGRYDMRRLKEVFLLLIANDAPLGPEWKDHPLKGEWSDHRECHVSGDFLLIYQVDDTHGKSGAVIFTRIGTHSDLFQE
ncbi:MAG: type II toxin-antitoxin system YafQ family toxin [Alphaproteobacteria bacterium]